MDGEAELEERVQEVLERWDRRLEAATAAWGELPEREQRRREVELDAAGESDEWVVVLWNWWRGASVADQEQLHADVSALAAALWAAAAEGRLDGESDEASSSRHLLAALERMRAVLAID